MVLWSPRIIMEEGLKIKKKVRGLVSDMSTELL